MKHKRPIKNAPTPEKPEVEAAVKVAEAEAEATPEENMKMWWYVSSTTMNGAIEEIQAREKLEEIHHLHEMFQQVVNNILYNPDIEDKAEAVKKAADEFGALVNQTDQGEADEYEADEDAKAMMKKEGDGEHPASHYLVVEDSKKPTTWHLRVKGTDGKPDHRLMGAAWAALHEGYRGNKYAGPDKEKALEKLKRMYKNEGMEMPSEKAVDEDLFAIKSLASDRVGGYAVLWGDETQKDLTGEYFDRDTAELTAIFDALGRLPFLYHHGMDQTLKTSVIGIVDILKADDMGLWYEAQLKLAEEYETYIRKLLEAKKLKTSSQTFPVARKVNDSGKIERWPIVEITATPTPAEYRMPAVEMLKAAYAEAGCDITVLDRFVGEEKAMDAEKARLELETLQFEILDF